MLHKEWLYEDRQIEGILDLSLKCYLADKNPRENPFLIDGNDSGYEDSETDDHKITMLRQLKKSVDVMHKFNEVHNKNGELSEVCLQ